MVWLSSKEFEDKFKTTYLKFKIFQIMDQFELENGRKITIIWKRISPINELLV